MNIHFTNKKLFEDLCKATLFRAKIGSHAYGLNDSESDIDFLNIYVPSENERNSFSFTHHQFQYKEDNIDYIFVSLPNFLRNALNGDSTINFEVINCQDIKNSSLDFLYDLRGAFNNYPIIRAYLGFAKRDLKHVHQGPDDREKNKRLVHALRGYYFAKTIYENKFTNILPDEKLQEIKSLKLITDYKLRDEKIKEIGEMVEKFRTLVNSELDKGSLVRFMKPENQKVLDNKLNRLYQTNEYLDSSGHIIDMTMIYDANENGVKY